MSDRSPETERWARRIATVLIVGFTLAVLGFLLTMMWALIWVVIR
jgi:hypothetical protein